VIERTEKYLFNEPDTGPVKWIIVMHREKGHEAFDRLVWKESNKILYNNPYERYVPNKVA
jgi:hypothetical protein